MNDTTEQTDTSAMLAAHAVCGRLIENMPDGVVFTSWEVMENYVGGQYSTDASTNGAKRALAVLAHEFDLVYSEDPKGSFVQVNAAGEFGGVQVRLWAHVPRAGQLLDGNAP